MSSTSPILTTATEDLIGTVVSERYRIVRCIGEGGMGCVYEAEHVLIRKKVALKCLHARYASEESVVERFRREALAATSIGNEHIVEVTDMGYFPNGSVFMVLEFLEGRDLMREITTAGPLSVGRAVRIVRQVCEALTAAHARGIVHRDLKPENIFLVTRGEQRDFVKVVDFGVSKFLDGEAVPLTDTGMMLGTPHYMAPEQIEGLKSVDHRADLYALGVVLYIALTGQPLFTAASVRQLMYAVLMTPPQSVRVLRNDAPEGLAAIVQRLVEKRPEARFQSCAALREALAPFADLDAPVSLRPSPSIAAVSGIRPSLPHDLGLSSTTPVPVRDDAPDATDPSLPPVAVASVPPAPTPVSVAPAAPPPHASRAGLTGITVFLALACLAAWSAVRLRHAHTQPPPAVLVAQTPAPPPAVVAPPPAVVAPPPRVVAPMAVAAPTTVPPTPVVAPTSAPHEDPPSRRGRRVRTAPSEPGGVRDSIPNL